MWSEPNTALELVRIQRREREDQLAGSTESTELQERLHFLQQSAAQFGMTMKREARRGSRRRSRRIRSGAQQNKTDKICRRKEIDGATTSTARCARRDEFDYATMQRDERGDRR